jgi:hypothetical protein
MLLNGLSPYQVQVESNVKKLTGIKRIAEEPGMFMGRRALRSAVRESIVRNYHPVKGPLSREITKQNITPPFSAPFSSPGESATFPQLQDQDS